MPDNKIKAILFDFGETLLSFGKVNTLRLFRQGARLTYDFLQSCNQPAGNFECYCWRNLISLRLHHLISNITGNDFDSLVLLKKLAEKKGIKLDEQQWLHLVWLWYEPLSKFGKAEPEIRETLSMLKESGIKLGIVSNTFVNGYCLDEHLKQLGIFDLFDIRLYSYQFDFRKPSPLIFIKAADRLGEKLKNIAYVGDRIDKDIKPALKLQMTAVLKKAYTNSGKNPPRGTWKIDRLSELPGLVEKINTQTEN